MEAPWADTYGDLEKAHVTTYKIYKRILARAHWDRTQKFRSPHFASYKTMIGLSFGTPQNPPTAPTYINVHCSGIQVFLKIKLSKQSSQIVFLNKDRTTASILNNNTYYIK